MAAYVHDFLHAATGRLWRDHRKQAAGTSRRHRREFSAGVLMGFRDKLREERQRSESVGLVWLGDADLVGFLKERHPRLGKLAGSGVRRTHAHAAGLQAGRSLTIHRPVSATASGSGGALPSP